MSPLIVLGAVLFSAGILSGGVLDRIYLTRRLRHAPFTMHFTFKGVQKAQLDAMMGQIAVVIAAHGFRQGPQSAQSSAPEKPDDQSGGADAAGAA